MAKKAKKTTKQKAKGSTPKAETNRPVLKVEKREVTGRKVKNLRDQGFLPASVYGREIESLSLKTKLDNIKEIFSKVGETSLVDLDIKGEKKKRTVLLKNPQYDPVSDNLLHIDFHQVDLTQTVTAEVPVELVGKSPAAESGEGVLVQLIDELEVEALPTKLPEKFIVDVSELKEIDDSVTISDLEDFSKEVDIKAEKDQILAKIEPLLEEIEEPVTPEEELLVGEEEMVEGEAAPQDEQAGEQTLPEAEAGEKGETRPKKEEQEKAAENENKKS